MREDLLRRLVLAAREQAGEAEPRDYEQGCCLFCGNSDAENAIATGKAPHTPTCPWPEAARLVDAPPTGRDLPGDPALRGYQQRVNAWMIACFGVEIAADSVERNHRFLEEALELVQSLGCTENEAHQLVAYVFSRAAGVPHQELGGVMVTAAALATPAMLDLSRAAEDELARVWTKVTQIRAKQAAKPRGSALPQLWPARQCSTCSWWKAHPMQPQELANAFAEALRPDVGDDGAAILEGLDIPPLGDCTLFECTNKEMAEEGAKVIVTRTGSGEATIVTEGDFGCVQWKERQPAPAGEGEVRNG